MEPLQQLLSQLESLQINFWGDEGRLHIQAPKGACTDELRQRIVQHKSELLKLPRRPSTKPGSCVAGPRPEFLPLSFAQDRLWFLNEWTGGGPSYNVPLAVRLMGPLDVRALKCSVRAICIRHEALRTVFPEVDGQPVQLVRESMAIPLTLLDLVDLEPTARERHIEAAMVQEGSCGFDLCKGPLFRLMLLKISDIDHIVLFTLHHIVSDGWSMPILLKELQAFYCAALRGSQADLPALAIQYADYAISQRQWLQGSGLGGHLDFWTGTLRNLPVLQLPLDYPRPLRASFEGREQSVELEKSTVQRLVELGRASATTPFMTMLSALSVLLHNATGQLDFGIGTPIANRDRPELQNLIGFFVNTIVLRCNVAGDPSFNELLRRMRKTCLEAYAHQEVPFERIIEELRVPRDLNVHPLFQVMFVFQNAIETPLLLPGLKTRFVHRESKIAKFDLTFTITASSSSWFLSCEYAEHLFDGATIFRMLDNFQQILREVAAQPDAPLSHLCFLTPAQRHQLAIEWNDTSDAIDTDATIDQLISWRSAQTPDQIAVQMEENFLTYGELERWSDSLALRLHSMGAVPGEPVAVAMEQSMEVIAALLGIMKSGAAYLPADARYPAARLAQMFEDAKVKIILSGPGTPSSLCGHDQKSLDVREPRRDGQSPNPRALSLSSPLLPAYLLYTSGSTGRPKGVFPSHRNLVYSTAARARLYGQQPQRFLLLSSFAFDSSVAGIFWTLCQGGTLVMPAAAEHGDVTAISSLIESAGITHLLCLPSLYHAMLCEFGNACFGSLQTAIVAGEACLPEHVLRHYRTVPHARLVNEYGPTEATVWATAHICPDRAPGDPRPVPIGKPIANATVYVLDRHLNAVPAGVSGELFIGGAGVANGYWNDPCKSAERFLPDPFACQIGSRMYRTGDLARHRHDGQIEFLGRCDDQIKIRGMRIEPAEIEQVLLSCPGIKQAAVSIEKDSCGAPQLIAYVVPFDQNLGKPELNNQLRRLLPANMVPSRYVFLPSLQRLPNGKLDRSALPAFLEHLSAGPGSRAPRTPRQQTIAEIWRDLMGRQEIGLDDNFFDLGGHSLMATQAVARIRKALDVVLPLRVLFENPTIQLLDEYLAAHQTLAASRVPSIAILPAGQAAPLSFSQQRLWFLHEWDPQSPAYNVPSAIRIRGPLDGAALLGALAAVVRRHSILRTRFTAQASKIVQVAVPLDHPVLQIVDLQCLAPAQRELAANNLVSSEARRPFPLSEEIPFRAILVSLAPADHILFINMHHIVSDGWSAAILIEELSANYELCTRGEPLKETALPIQYSDFAASQRSWRQANLFDGQLDYWKNQLAGAATLALPSSRSPQGSAASAGICSTVISEELSQALRSAGRGEGATTFMTLLSVLYALLHRYSGQEDISVGTPIANRGHLEVQNLIGCFVNDLVLRQIVPSQTTFRQLLRNVRKCCLEAYENQDVPFELLVEELRPPRDEARHPLFQVFFVFQAAQARSRSISGMSWEPLAAQTGATKFDLTFSATEVGQRLKVDVSFNSSLYDAPMIQRMLLHLHAICEQAVRSPNTPLANLTMLTAPERHAIVQEWNDTDLDSVNEQDLHGPIRHQAQRNPDAIALVFDESHLSYNELDIRTNQLAHYLCSLGVGPEQTVGVSLHRSLEMVIGILGIARAGAAYLPLDPEYPHARLIEMIQDSGSRILLVSGSAPEDWEDLHTIDLRKDWGIIGQCPSTAPPPRHSSANMAYVIYTSGSTGRPKGVVNTHQGIDNRLRWMQNRYALAEEDVILQKTSFGFDVSVWEFFLPLRAGARLVIAPPGAHRDPSSLMQLFIDEQVTMVHFVPSMLQALLAVQTLKYCRPLRAVICSGEALSAELQSAFFRRSQAQLHNLYGPTEASIDVTSWECRRGESSATVPIGRPISKMKTYVLDSRLEPMPLGVTGDLYLGGIGLAREYLHSPLLTAPRFVPNPFGPPGSRLYATGDLARYNADGTIDFLGRRDSQVKIRGMRVELGEIEAVIAAHPQVTQAAVVLRQDASGQDRIAAFVVARDSTDVAAELRRFLSEKLPPHMVPTAIEVLAAMPMTLSGKIDKKSLPALKTAVPANTDYVAPTTPRQRILCDIWGEILHRPRVGIHDNFFDIGGDSIQSIQVAARARQAGVLFTVRQLFRHQTIAQLAEVCTQTETSAAPSSLPQGTVPLIPTQYWLFDRGLVDIENYNGAYLFDLPSLPQPLALRESLLAVIRHHDALRLRFSRRGGEIHQFYADPQSSISLSEIDLSMLPAPTSQASIEPLATSIRKSLHVFNGPLFRVVLINRGERQSCRLLIVVHHLLIDGVSWRILLDDLMTGYIQRTAGKKIALPPVTTSFGQWAAHVAQWSQSEQLRQHAQELLKLPWSRVHDLPVDFENPSNRYADSQTFTSRLDASATSALIELANSVLKIRVPDLLVASLAASIADWTANPFVLIEMTDHGRELDRPGIDLSRTVGYITVNYPLLLDADALQLLANSIGLLQRQIEQGAKWTLLHGLLRYLWNGPLAPQIRDLPEPQIKFNYHGQLDGEASRATLLRPATETVKGVLNGSNPRRYLFNVEAMVAGGSLQIVWKYSAAAHRLQTVRRLADDTLNRLMSLSESLLSCST